MVKIRKAEAEDAAEVARVQVETWQRHYRGQLPESYLAGLSIEHRTKVWRDIFTASPPRRADFVAMEDGRITGFCCVGSCRDEDADDGTGELEAIYVEVARHRRGIGAALMNTALDFLREQGFLDATLWVLKSNAASIAFYERRGWKADGAEKIDRNEVRVFEEIRYRIGL
ncbi:MAG: putative acetyltransferase [Akkermansiaceae bacterium]|nr:putative acetyltransferase [Akkermansiaceae bacterium]